MYEVIYADPPWTFQVWNKDTGSGRSAESHYPTLNREELRSLNVQSLANRDCALLLWSVMPNLPEAISLGEAWGFKYKTCVFTWVKQTITQTKWHIGMGYYTRANAELCLLFTKGHVKRKSKAVRQLIVAPVTKHSAKPHEAYERIEALFHGPYVELFARNTREGWTSIGNEIDGMDIRDVLVDKL